MAEKALNPEDKLTWANMAASNGYRGRPAEQ
jgi:hypothetical protein